MSIEHYQVSYDQWTLRCDDCGRGSTRVQSRAALDVLTYTNLWQIADDGRVTCRNCLGSEVKP